MDQYIRQYVNQKVSHVVFSLLSPKMIKEMAASKIVTPELYDKEGYPVDGGLMDTRLGVIDPGLRCRTCGSKLKECLGHFGYIELARPVVHINFVNVIMNLLRSTCSECGRILVPKQKFDQVKAELDKIAKEEGVESRRKAVKEVISKLKTISKCPYCKAMQKKITLDKPHTFVEDGKKITPIELRIRLEKVPDEDLALFGINPESARPEWMVLTIMPIPPVTMRPSITLESGERSEDDLTHKLGDIVRINQRLFENINAGAPEVIIEDLWELLQYHITTFFNNSVAQLPPARHRSGHPLKTITERIKSKEGRIRHNLAGKRTNFSARTVVSPDPRLKLNEVGVPMEMALKLTVPERVTAWNIEYLKKFVERGPTKYPGANYVVRPDGKKKRITDETKEASLEELEPGYLVERHLMDGDVALFNRQPSLHRMSMMCHKVRVLPYKTLRMNPSVNNPYNADYDGDDMNLHIPQTEEARAETEIIMDVKTQLISPRYGLSVIGGIQDSITGNFLLTKKQTSLPYQEAVDLLFSIGVEDFSSLGNKEIVSGKEIFSCVLPDDFNFVGRSKSKDEEEVLIRNGKLQKGIIDVNAIGQEKGLMLRSLHKQYGEDEALNILERIFHLGIKYLLNLGFTMPLSDIDLPEKAEQQISQELDLGEQKVQALIKKYKMNELECFPGKNLSETLELKILEVLNKARNKVGDILTEYSRKDAAILTMALSGARGKLLNMAQMSACVGQQALRGKRIIRGYDGRTLSCFKQGDLGPEAHGFIRDGFKKSMSPAEFFFQSMVGRDSLMDTALRTPKSGYLYRRLSNALQDIKVEYDHTTRDASGKIIQFEYGEDSIDVSKSEGGQINVKAIVNEVLEKS